MVETALENLIACPQCDALHRVTKPLEGERASCRRCGAVLVTPRSGAVTRILALSLTALILMFAAIFFPFLELEINGIHSQASVFDAALAYSHGLMLPLSVALTGVIILVPVVRLLAIIIALWPMFRGRAASERARQSFRLAAALKPWSMAEILIVGVAVALVKIASLATVLPGPAFWAFGALVIVSVLQDTFMCRYTIWSWLDKTPRS
jgi:paraquat-inducible protein A